MDFAVQEETFNTADYRWLGSKNAVNTAKPATLLIPTGGDQETDLYPDGHLVSGVLLARYTSGANTGLWAPYVNDDVGGEGLDTVAGIALDGFQVRKDQNGALVSTVTTGSVLLPYSGVQVVLANLPQLLLTNGTTNYTPVAADLAGFALAYGV